jgi:ferritin-like metal-binding protein YciE
MESQVRELLVEELKDAYSAEKQALRCVQKALRMASAHALREGIELHIEQTQTQIGAWSKRLSTQSASRTARGPYWI